MQTHTTKFKLAFPPLCCNKKKINWVTKRKSYWICTAHCIIFLCLTSLHFPLGCPVIIRNWASTAWCCSISTELLSQHLLSAYLNCTVKWLSLNHLTPLSTFGTVQKSVKNRWQVLKFALLLGAGDVMWIAPLKQGLSTGSAFMAPHAYWRRGLCLDSFSYVSSFVFNPEWCPPVRAEQYCLSWEQPTQTATAATASSNIRPGSLSEDFSMGKIIHS